MIEYAYVYKKDMVSKEVIEKIKKLKPGDFLELSSNEYRQVLNITKIPMVLG